MKNKLAKAFIFFTGGSFIGILTQVIKGKIMSVILGSHGIGIYSQLTRTFNFAFTFSSLGFKNGTIKTISESINEVDDKRYNKEYSSVAIFLLFISSIVSCLGVAFSKIISHLIFSDSGECYVLVSIIFAIVPVAVLTSCYKSLLSGHMAVKKLVKSQIFSDLLSLIPFIVLIYYFHLLGAVIAFSVYQAIRFFFIIFFYFREIRHVILPKRINFCWSHIRSNLNYGISGIFLGSLNLLILLYIGRTVIAELGSSDNGLLSAALRVSTIYFGAIYANATSYYFPLLVKAKNKNELQILIDDTNKFYIYLLPPIIICLMCFGEVIIQILFTNEFTYAAKILMFFLIGDLFRISNETRSLVFLAKKKFLYYNLTFTIWGIFYTLIAIFLLNKIGILGVSVAYLISHFINFIVTSFFLKKELQLSIGKSFMKSFFAAIITCSLVLWVNFQNDQILIRVVYSFVFFVLWFVYSYSQNDFKEYVIKAIDKLKHILKY